MYPSEHLCSAPVLEKQPSTDGDDIVLVCQAGSLDPFPEMFCARGLSERFARRPIPSRSDDYIADMKPPYVPLSPVLTIAATPYPACPTPLSPMPGVLPPFYSTTVAMSHCHLLYPLLRRRVCERQH